MHTGSLQNGTISVGDKVSAEINVQRRQAIMRNHTSAHLLQAALRKVLGTHVEQAGQLVSAKTMRFDFTHFSAMTPEEIAQVEKLVNDEILAGINVTTQEMSIDEARKKGAMALFGEKYGDVVRVVSAGDFSIELCGGTHVDNTAKLGLFKIISEGSVAAGVRRIEAVTGYGVLLQFDMLHDMLAKAAHAFKLNNIEDIVRRAELAVAELKTKDKEIEALNSKIASSQVDNIINSAKSIGNVKVITAVLENSGADTLRQISDKIRDKSADYISVLAGINDGKATLACSCGKDAVKSGAHAGNIVRETAKLAGGSGGGKPDYAMAGAKDISKINDALSQVESIVANMLK